MPPPAPRSTSSDIIDHVLVAASTIRRISDNSGAPFTNAIAALASSIFAMVQAVKANKEQYFRMVKKIYVVLNAIIDLNLSSDDLPPATLYHIGEFTETLQKVHASLETQRDQSRFRQLLRKTDNAAQLEACNVGLQNALEAFGVQLGMSVLWDLEKMQQNARKQHESLLAFVSTQRDMFDSDSSRSVRSMDECTISSKGNSSSSFSLLPAQPKIFNGRESELRAAVEMLLAEYARISILGPGGMGKTSLATAVLHHPKVIAKYSSRIFVSCDSATSSVDLIALIGLHLGLEPRQNLPQAIVRHLAAGPSALVILDNLETSWEPRASRAGVEEFLSLLTDVPRLSLIVACIFPAPTALMTAPPDYDAWRRMTRTSAMDPSTFIDIADDVHDDREMEQLLLLADNLPLAVCLLANAADYEGCPIVLSRWENENTALFFKGSDRRSNLDASIMLSFLSPRMNSGAKKLLSILSLLPDGLSDTELLQCGVPIPDILSCKAALLSTSLAYTDHDRRLKTLVPIREYVRHNHPPAPALLHPLQKYVNQLLSLYKKFDGLSSGDLAPRITSNLGNIQSILARSLADDDPELLATIRSVLSLSSFHRVIGRRQTPLMDRVSEVLVRVEDHQLRGVFVTEVLLAWRVRPIQDVDDLIVNGREYLMKADDLVQEVKFYNTVGRYYHMHNDKVKAQRFYEDALRLADRLDDGVLKGTVRDSLAMVQWSLGNYSAGQQLAHEAIQCARTKIRFASRSRREQDRGNVLCRARGLLPQRSPLREVAGTARLVRIKQRREYAESREIYAAMARDISPEHSPYEYAIALLNIATLDIAMGASADVIHLELREGHTGAAKSMLERCARDFYGRSDEGSIFCSERLADLANGMDSIYTTTKLAIHKALRCFGDLFLAQGDSETAGSLCEVALQGFEAMDVHRWQGDCLLRLGDIFKHHGDEDKAVELWKAARPKFERSSQTKDMARVDVRLQAVT
ncbi:hypothetical protein DFH09DRAFT_1323459 [Mycena vulgaris]|nr:hypothetical protein DFH09DRAFT_1323459 [Mycena vulgaris]